MTREEAIATLENGEFWDECAVPCACDNRAVMEFHEALDVAIAAIRAQQESNTPLTLEELREMDGEPVWVERHSRFDCTQHWALVHVHRSGDVYLTERNCGQILFIIWDKVYRRKPEEVRT